MISLNDDIITIIISLLPLKDINSLSLVCHHVNKSDTLNWLNYFVYHAHIPESLLNPFKPIDKPFMISQGKDLLSAPYENIKQYLSVWNDLVKFDVCRLFSGFVYDLDDAGTYVSFQTSKFHNDISGINFEIREKIKGTVTIREQYFLDGDLIREQSYILPQIYDRFKFHLLRQTFLTITIWDDGSLVYNGINPIDIR